MTDGNECSGQFHVAEVTSRFKDIEHFQNLLGSLGFRRKTMVGSFMLAEAVKLTYYESPG